MKAIDSDLAARKLFKKIKTIPKRSRDQIVEAKDRAGTNNQKGEQRETKRPTPQEWTNFNNIFTFYKIK